MSNKVIKTFTSTGAGTWTCPAGVTSILVRMIGAGGGGGGGGSSIGTDGGCGGGGGGGAQHVEFNFTTTPGTVYSYYVAVGGAGGTGSIRGVDTPTHGTDGEDSWFSANAAGTIAHGAMKGNAPNDNTSSYTPANGCTGGVVPGVGGLVNGYNSPFMYAPFSFTGVPGMGGKGRSGTTNAAGSTFQSEIPEYGGGTGYGNSGASNEGLSMGIKEGGAGGGGGASTWPGNSGGTGMSGGFDAGTPGGGSNSDRHAIGYGAGGGGGGGGFGQNGGDGSDGGNGGQGIIVIEYWIG